MAPAEPTLNENLERCLHLPHSLELCATITFSQGGDGAEKGFIRKIKLNYMKDERAADLIVSLIRKEQADKFENLAAVEELEALLDYLNKNLFEIN